MVIDYFLLWFSPLQQLGLVDDQYFAGICSDFEHKAGLPDPNFELLLNLHVRYPEEHKFVSDSKQYFLATVVLLENLESAIT